MSKFSPNLLLFFDSDKLKCMAYNFHGMADNIVRNCVFLLSDFEGRMRNG